MIKPIDAHSVSIQNADDLEEVVSVNSAIDRIYFENDISLTGGITIHPDRTSLTIDGKHPEQGETIHTFTDMESTSSFDTIGIRSTSNITITIKNMIINGYNYYGVPYIIFSSAFIIDTSNVSVVYENVKYKGPQMTYNRYGLTRYIDCDIEISKTGSTQPQEVGEVNRVELGGRTTVYHTSHEDNRAVFWFNNLAGNSSLTVLPGADIKINSVYSYFMYNLDGAILAPVTYTISPGASLDLTVSRGISLSSSHVLNSFLVDFGASFHFFQTGDNGSAATLYMSGELMVNQDADFFMKAPSGSAPILHFTGGQGRTITLDNPRSFVLYSPNAPALRAASTAQFDLSGGQLNLWYTAKTPVESAGGFDDITPYKWFKKNYASTLEVVCSLTQNTTSAITNLTTEDEPYPDTSSLLLHNAMVISAGDWPVSVNPVCDDARPVSGEALPNSNIRIEYTTEGDVSHLIDSIADESGIFSVPTSTEIPPDIPEGTEVSISTNIPFLIKKMTVTSLDAGELSIISAPVKIVFKTDPVSLIPILLPRIDSQTPVVVFDDRIDRSRWNLLAAVTGPLTSQSGHILEDAVVFRYFDEEHQPVLVPLSLLPTEVYTAGPDPGTTNVVWNEDEGILVRISEPMHPGTEYETTVNWTLLAIEE